MLDQAIGLMNPSDAHTFKFPALTPLYSPCECTRDIIVLTYPITVYSPQLSQRAATCSLRNPRLRPAKAASPPTKPPVSIIMDQLRAYAARLKSAFASAEVI